jgi:hypothetical protein
VLIPVPFPAITPLALGAAVALALHQMTANFQRTA